jgi:conflict system STAND superfamily ATPase
MMTARPARVVAPGPPAFELHTLGWRAFQDLCAGVLRTVWGQSAQAFADSNDAGRDGAFYGVWHDPPGSAGSRDYLRGPFVLQCKHTKRADSTLSQSALAEEFDKVPGLVDRGLCHSYVLMTNARVTGNSEEKIRVRLRQAGVEHPLVLGAQWMCDTIAAHRELRLFVPRIYGLGDLSQILDERAYTQASALMAAARDQVATFVITEPYRKAAQALQDHGFVLLLGEPAVGKSVIALMLALAAADNWGCLTIKSRTASELVGHWNPNELGQFFWVDDAFGAVRHEEQLTQDWARSMPHVMTAISKGARVALTSRSYIYQEARPLLKEYAYPRLREQKVLVNVEDLTLDERKQILYNHIARGDQPAKVRARMKPYLDHAAVAEPFRPEMAHRLGQRAFTSGLSLTEAGIVDFMTHPRQFLRDVYEQLGTDQQAALALVYAAAVDGSLSNPLVLSDAQRDIIDRAGGTPAGVTRALDTLTGSFLQVTGPPLGRPGWAFRHPTLWEGFASWVPTQSHLLTVLLAGLTDDALLTRVDCDDENASQRQGTLLRVPPALYRAVSERLALIRPQPFTGQKWERREGGRLRTTDSYQEYQRTRQAVLAFLTRRSSDAFLRIYLNVDPDLPASLVNFTSYVYAVSEPGVLARLHRAGLLSESVRLQAVERMAHLAVTTPDDGWIQGPDWKVLLTPDDHTRLMDEVRDELVPRLESGYLWEGGEREEDDPLESALQGYEIAFESQGDFETAQAFARARDMYSQLPPSARDDYGDWEDRAPLVNTRLAPAPNTSRSIFDDIDTE